MQSNKINTALIICTIVLAVVCYIQHNQIGMLRERILKLEIRYEKLIVKLENRLSDIDDNIADMQYNIGNMEDDIGSLPIRRR